MNAYTMRDGSRRTQSQIESVIRQAESALGKIERCEQVLGPLRVDASAVRLQLRDCRRLHLLKENPWDDDPSQSIEREGT